jgi:hypothetical protein
MNFECFALTVTRYICETRRMQAIINDDPVFVVDEESLWNIRVFVKSSIQDLHCSESMKKSLFTGIINTVKAGDYLGYTIDEVERQVLTAIKNAKVTDRLH